MRKPDFEKYYPPGYEYRKELNWLAGLWGLGMGGSLYFFGALFREVQSLYQYVDGERILRRDRMAVSFTELTEWYWTLWLPAFVFLLVLPLFHSFYYYKETKSIYIMRRLPESGVTFKSCVQAPVLFAVLGLGTALFVYVLYFGIYMLSVPASMGRFI